MHRDTMAAPAKMMTSEQLKAFDVSLEPRRCARLRRHPVRPGVPGGPAADRSRCAVRRGHAVRLGHARQQPRSSTKKQLTILDPAFGRPVSDLRKRDFLDKTVVICTGEFGRTPKVNPAGGRDHWPNGFSVALAGGGVQGGQVIGATDPGGKGDPTDPVTVGDLHATVLTAVGIDPAKLNQTPIGRTVKFAEGKPIGALLG